MAVFMRRLLSDSPEKYCFSKVSLTSDESLTAVDFEMPYPEARHKIVGYCNGLFCAEYADGRIVVWNPSNKSFQEVPSPANSISPLLGKGDESWTPHTIFLVCGFGHDINTDDYKVIVHVITYFDDGGISNTAGFVREAFVYSIVEGGTWKEIPYPRDLHSVGVVDASGTSVNGCCYWKAEAVGEHKSYPRVCILSLDLATLEFSLVEPPEHFRDIQRSWLKLITLVEFEGSLSLISLEEFSPYLRSWVWIGRLGWRFKHKLQLYGEAESGMPLGYLNEEFMLFEGSNGSRLLIYNTTIEYFGGLDLIQDRRHSMRLFPYVESTLHLNNAFS